MAKKGGTVDRASWAYVRGLNGTWLKAEYEKRFGQEYTYANDVSFARFLTQHAHDNGHPKVTVTRDNWRHRRYALDMRKLGVKHRAPPGTAKTMNNGHVVIDIFNDLEGKTKPLRVKREQALVVIHGLDASGRHTELKRMTIEPKPTVVTHVVKG